MRKLIALSIALASADSPFRETPSAPQENTIATPEMLMAVGAARASC